MASIAHVCILRRKFRELRARVVRLEAAEHARSEGDPTEIMLERALEAQGVDASDPIRSGVRALADDLWALRKSTTGEGSVARAIDRLAQRADLLVTLTSGR